MGDPATSGHRVVAIPYPGRGHINPMLNFCKLLVSKRPDIDIQVIVTEEWFGILNSDDGDSTTITFTTIPNVVPSEATRGSDLAGFLEAVQAEMEGPVEQALEAIGTPIDLIIADTFLGWAADLGRKRNTRVASFWPLAVSTFLAVRRFNLIPKLVAGKGPEERIEIPGIGSIRVKDLGTHQSDYKRMIGVVARVVSSAAKADCVIFRSMEELEGPAIAALKADLSCPMFTIGPAIPYFTNKPKPNTEPEPDYICWLNSQQERSVLYVSLGSFMSTSSSQLDELAAGLKASSIPFLWAGGSQSSELSDMLDDRGMLVPWCDQMRVLSHPSVGGFLTHCGWNSTLETAFAGVPALTFPLFSEQCLNSKIIVDDWGIGWRMEDKTSLLLKKFMGLKELDRMSKELQARVFKAVREDGSTGDFDGFLSWINGASQIGDD